MLRSAGRLFSPRKSRFLTSSASIMCICPSMRVTSGSFKACKPFETPFGLSHHNPFAGRWAARQCLTVVARHIAERRVRLTALLGFNASLLAVIGYRWPTVSSAPLHMILHSQLGEAMDWRSRNPFIRATDLVSQLK